MAMSRMLMLTVAPLLAMYGPTCVPRAVLPTVPPEQARLEELWQRSTDLPAQDLLYGPWGPERAPDPEATYTFIDTKRGGVNPGMTVRDAGGRRWKGVEDGFVRFEYHGWHQELIDRRIRPADVRWACELLAGLTLAQWREALQAGGYGPALTDRYIDRLQTKIRQGMTLEAGDGGPAS
jgi:hypothetical protein